MEMSFYEMAVKIVGELPPGNEWLYILITMCLIFAPFMFLAIIIGKVWR